MLTPDGGSADRAQVWNAAELAEKRKDARTAREWTIALPAELDAKQRAELARSFAGELSRRYGVAVDLSIHLPDREGDNRNHHAHLLTTTRQVSRDPDGQLVMGHKASIELSDKARLARGLGRAADEVSAVRQQWEQLANRALERAGRSERIDARSLRAQGLDREATTHLGPIASEMERRGAASDRGDGNRRAQAHNAERDGLKAQIIDLQAERQRRELARIERMSARELRTEIARIRPDPIISQAELWQASPDYKRACDERSAVNLAIGRYEQERLKASAEARECRARITHWQETHPIAAKLHGLGWWRSKRASVTERQEATAQQKMAEAEKRITPLESQSTQLEKAELLARQHAQQLAQERRKPLLERVQALEKVAQQKEREEGKGRKLDELVKGIQSHALLREMKAYGYSDTGEYWQALPAPVRTLVNGINAAPKEARPQVLAKLREELQREPGLVQTITDQLEHTRSRSRGLSR
jgi:hypothetical protein